MMVFETDGVDVVADYGDGLEVVRRCPTAEHAAEHAAYLNWREWVEHPPYPTPEHEEEDVALAKAAAN